MVDRRGEVKWHDQSRRRKHVVFGIQSIVEIEFDVLIFLCDLDIEEMYSSEPYSPSRRECARKEHLLYTSQRRTPDENLKVNPALHTMHQHAVLCPETPLTNPVHPDYHL